jgi:hypothetical protein
VAVAVVVVAVVVAQAQAGVQSSEQGAEEASSGVCSLHQYFRFHHQYPYQSLKQKTQPYSSAAHSPTSCSHYSHCLTHSSSSKTQRQDDQNPHC